jgi:hypothetical protein
VGGAVVIPALLAAGPLHAGTRVTGTQDRAAPATLPDTPIYLIRRVVLLNLPNPQSNSALVQRRLKVRLAQLEQRRHKRRKRLFPTEPPGKATRKRPLPPRIDDPQKARRPADPDVLTPDQQTALAQGLLSDALTARLKDRLNILTIPDAEVKAALASLHLSAQEAAEPAGALRLCGKLDAQAVLVPQILKVGVRDSVTRDGVIHVLLHIPGAEALGSPVQGTVELPPENAFPEGQLPSEIEVAGSARVNRVIFSTNYTQSLTDTLGLAAQQAAGLIVQTLTTGRSAPFMHAKDRLAIVPVSAPTVADKLLFTPQGRQLVRGAARDLPSDVSPRFTPDLLPLLPDSVLMPDQVRAQLVTSFVGDRVGTARTARLDAAQAHRLIHGESYWTGADTPDVKACRTLAKRLNVDYVLLAHITDIELEGGPPPSAAPAITPAVAAGSPAVDQQSEARAVAVGTLVRVSDGAVLWRAHSSATMSAPLSHPTAPLIRATDRTLAGDAVRFALVDLSRQLDRYRASFAR